jgi:uncharacterized DUF497 family protein
MGFQWDPAKDVSNRRKHRIGFREAAEIFHGRVLVAADTRRDYGEQRHVALGEYDGIVIRVVYTQRDGDIRIISAWKANRHDRETYQEARETGAL